MKKKDPAGKLARLLEASACRGRLCTSLFSQTDHHGRVAQLDRVSASEAEGRGFESRLAHHVKANKFNALAFDLLAFFMSAFLFIIHAKRRMDQDFIQAT